MLLSPRSLKLHVISFYPRWQQQQDCLNLSEPRLSLEYYPFLVLPCDRLRDQQMMSHLLERKLQMQMSQKMR